jgi:hypothetical protein
MLSVNDLKKYLHQPGTSRIVKLLAIMAALAKPSKVAEIKDVGRNVGLRNIQDWNVSQYLRESRGKAILTKGGWELTDAGTAEVATVFSINGVNVQPPVALNLRSLMAKIKDDTTVAFVDEAVRCYEGGQLRSAIVMAWLAALDVVYKEVLTKKLAEFNAVARQQDPKWQNAVDRDGLALMKESSFLERAFTVRVITKNEKAALNECLTRRNTCGHPNSFKIGANAVAHHIETLILNVFQKYGPEPPEGPP